MSVMSEFKQALIVAAIESRKANASVIEALPINAERSAKYQNLNYRIFPEKGVLSDEEHKNVMEHARKIGCSAIEPVFHAFKDRIVVDLMGHALSTDKITLADYERSSGRNILSIPVIAQRLDLAFAKLIYNISGNETLDHNWDDLFDQAFSLVDFEYGHLMIAGSYTETCSTCGEHMRILMDMSSLKISLYENYVGAGEKKPVSPCAFPNGVGQYDIKIKVPSGKLVIANALTAIMPKEIHDYAAEMDYFEKRAGHSMSISTSEYANVLNSEFYAQLNVMYIQVGDGGLTAFMNKSSGDISIKQESNYGYAYDSGKDEVVPFEEPNYTEDEKILGTISLDLWAVTAMCYDTFVDFCQRTNKDVSASLDRLDAFVVDVECGDYKVTSYYFDSDRKKKYSTGIPMIEIKHCTEAN